MGAIVDAKVCPTIAVRRNPAFEEFEGLSSSFRIFSCRPSTKNRVRQVGGAQAVLDTGKTVVWNVAQSTELHHQFLDPFGMPLSHFGCVRRRDCFD